MPSINYNPAGIIALQNFNLAQNNLSKTQSQIATGKRVQSAQDDPAALATSQRLTAQKNGVGVGIENSKAADKLLSTADKALSSMQDILQSMRQLAVKASNDATTDADRLNYQKQIDDYRKELDRIARDTRYKERHLLNGDIKNSVASKAAAGTILTNITVNESTLQGAGTGATSLIQDVGTGSVTVNTTTNTYDVTFQIKLVANGNSVDAQIFASDSIGNFGTAALTTIANVHSSGGQDADLTGFYTTSGLTFHLNQVDLTADIGKTAVLRITSYDSGVQDDKSIAFQIGANAGEEMLIGVGDMSSYGLRITQLDVKTSLSSKNSVSMIDDAIDRITNERAKIGSMQNRLQVSISNSETYKANLEGSLAQEIDVNYAEAVLQQTIDQVKQQASLAMLTQANQSQQAVLSLLQ